MTRPLLKAETEICPQLTLPCRGTGAPEADSRSSVCRTGREKRKDSGRMIPKICGACDQQVLEKLASLYWAWVTVDGRRHAYKQKVCSTCMQEHYVKLIGQSEDPVLICPACGIGTADDMDPIYLTYCMPGMPTGQSEMPTCGACAARIRSVALRGSEALPDRGASVGGPQPQRPSATAVWDALGLRPGGR